MEQSRAAAAAAMFGSDVLEWDNFIRSRKINTDKCVQAGSPRRWFWRGHFSSHCLNLFPSHFSRRLSLTLDLSVTVNNLKTEFVFTVGEERRNGGRQNNLCSVQQGGSSTQEPVVSRYCAILKIKHLLDFLLNDLWPGLDSFFFFFLVKLKYFFSHCISLQPSTKWPTAQQRSPDQGLNAPALGDFITSL